MSTTVTYKNETLTTATNQTKVLQTSGKYMEDDVTIVDVTSAQNPQSKSVTISSAGTTEVTPDVGYDALSKVTITTPSGTAGRPYDTITYNTDVCNATVIPSVTNNAGYINGGTVTGNTTVISAIDLVEGNIYEVDESGEHTVTKFETATVPDALIRQFGGNITGEATITVSSTGLVTATYEDLGGTEVYPVYQDGWMTSEDYTKVQITVVGEYQLTNGNNIGYGNTDGSIPIVGIAKAGYAHAWDSEYPMMKLGNGQIGIDRVV